MQALAAVSQMMAMQGVQGMPVMGPGTPSAPLQRDFNSMQSLHSMDSGSEAGLRSPQLPGRDFADSMSPCEGQLCSACSLSRTEIGTEIGTWLLVFRWMSLRPFQARPC